MSKYTQKEYRAAEARLEEITGWPARGLTRFCVEELGDTMEEAERELIAAARPAQGARECDGAADRGGPIACLAGPACAQPSRPVRFSPKIGHQAPARRPRLREFGMAAPF